MYESRRVAYEELNFSMVELAYPQDFSRTRAHLIAWRGFAAMQLVQDRQTFSLSLPGGSHQPQKLKLAF